MLLFPSIGGVSYKLFCLVGDYFLLWSQCFCDNFVGPYVSCSSIYGFYDGCLRVVFLWKLSWLYISWIFLVVVFFFLLSIPYDKLADEFPTLRFVDSTTSFQYLHNSLNIWCSRGGDFKSPCHFTSNFCHMGYYVVLVGCWFFIYCLFFLMSIIFIILSWRLFPSYVKVF